MIIVIPFVGVGGWTRCRGRTYEVGVSVHRARSGRRRYYTQNRPHVITHYRGVERHVLL